MPRRHATSSTLALVLATALPFGLANAAPLTADAPIQQFTIQLIDLDPNDGIVPSISFSDVSHEVHSRYSLDGGVTPLYGEAIFAPGTASVSGPAGSATAFWGADTWASGVTARPSWALHGAAADRGARFG